MATWTGRGNIVGAPKRCLAQLRRVVDMRDFLEEVTPELSFRGLVRDWDGKEEGISDGMESMHTHTWNSKDWWVLSTDAGLVCVCAMGRVVGEYGYLL